MVSISASGVIHMIKAADVTNTLQTAGTVSECGGTSTNLNFAIAGQEVTFTLTTANALASGYLLKWVPFTGETLTFAAATATGASEMTCGTTVLSSALTPAGGTSVAANI